MKCSEFKAGIVSHEIFRDRGSENLNPATVGKRIPLFVDSEIRLGREGRLGVLLQLLANLMDFPGKPDEYIRHRVADFFGIADDDALAVAQNNMTGHADDG